MTSLKELLATYGGQDEGLFEELSVDSIDFSGATYLIQVNDHKLHEEFWPFIQLEETGKLKDCFCSCDYNEDNSYCAHILISLKTILYGHEFPIHIRFYKSLWYVLTSLYLERIGFDPESLTCVEDAHYVHSSVTGKHLFSARGVSGEGRSHLTEIMEKRIEENEENSIKFSNLSAEELEQWRQGKPSPQLQYELSFWADIAKWLMFLQDSGHPYSIVFSYDDDGFPNNIRIEFPEIIIEFYLARAILSQVIPTLRTVSSPLPVYDYEDQAIQSITYDPVQKVLSVQVKEEQENVVEAPTELVIQVGSWNYIPEKGFYCQEQHHLVENAHIPAEKIGQNLESYTETFKKYLTGCPLHSEKHKVRYAIEFDEDWGLHLYPYLFEKGDLQKELCCWYGQWVYLHPHGFYAVQDALFESAHTHIPYDKVSDFISRHRLWLNGQKGFHTKLTSLETKLSYSLNTEGLLSFESYAGLADDTVGCMDFNEWVYITDHGFYAKISSRYSWPVRPGVKITRDKISAFIVKNRDDLEHVEHFFCRVCPVRKVGVDIRFMNFGALQIVPHYELDPLYANKEIQYFGRFIYVSEEGFSELPSDFHLPSKYSEPIEIPPHGVSDFIKMDLDVLKPYIIDIDPRLQNPKWMRLVADKVQRREGKSGHALHLQLVLETDLGKVNVTDLWKAQQRQSEYLMSPAGLLNVDDPAYQWLKKIHSKAIHGERGSIKLSLLEFLRLNAYEEIQAPTGNGIAERKTCEALHSLKEFSITEKPNLNGLESHLRPYQEIGVDWLWFLYENHLSGLLCDDMGLGKTHQAMALLAGVINRCEQEKRRPRFLVVCPTSVIYHWEEKLRNFFPHLKVYTFYGAQRNVSFFDDYCDLLLTSYGILRLEKKLLLSRSFEVAIFDEIQVAKNHQSQVHRVVSKVKARLALGLTGTPIENNLRELKALFDLVLPGYMPSEAEYKNFFLVPIEKHNDEDRKHLLSRYIKPFIMRRKKSEVLEELPEKTEEIAYCELSQNQRDLYDGSLLSSRNSLLSDLQNQEKSIPYIHIFALLTRLKQICNHPALYLNECENYKNYESGKWELFKELVSQARESGQKMVVFSQFLGMLDIMEMYFKEEGIQYAMIRGETQNRGVQLDMFRDDPKCEVFLGSLGAVGLGVDLTAASVVIHYDRWWNAARENQATDRVHRIGQQRGVQVFKLVTKDSFEERIHALIAEKGRLMEEVVGTDDSNAVKKFTRDEIIQLLHHVG